MAPLLGKIVRLPSSANLLVIFGVGSTIGRGCSAIRRPTTNSFSTPCHWALASTALTLAGCSVTTASWNDRPYSTSSTPALWHKLSGTRFANFFPSSGSVFKKRCFFLVSQCVSPWPALWFPSSSWPRGGNPCSLASSHVCCVQQPARQHCLCLCHVLCVLATLSGNPLGFHFSCLA